MSAFCLPTRYHLLTSTLYLIHQFSRDKDAEELRRVVAKTFPNAFVAIQPISLATRDAILSTLLQVQETTGKRLVVFNLCDGTEDGDGYPGISVVRGLEQAKLAFTGACSNFYSDTTSKPVLKRMLEQNRVPTSPFVEILPGSEEADLDRLAEKIGYRHPSIEVG